MKFRYDGNHIRVQASSTFKHRYSKLASYKGSPFVTGGKEASDGITTEIYDGERWLRAEDYPFANSLIWLYASISTNDAVYIIGGTIDGHPGTQTSKIVKYDKHGWAHVNDLAYRRYSLEAIKYNGRVMVIGGYTDLLDFYEP